jgi:hydrophobic/amphiphilic exporter-1 (mainly G- bacteria), HAE1 family
MWSFFVHKRKFTFAIVFVLILLGIASMLSIPKESNPEVVIPILVVSSPFPGASALDVESLVTNPIEDAVLGIDDVKRVTSTSQVGFSSLILEFEIGVDIDEKKIDTEEAIDGIRQDLPSDADDPTVSAVSFDDRPIKIFALAGPYEIEQLTGFGKDLQDEVERISGVTKVELTGGSDREIRILVDRFALDQFGLSLAQVTAAISRANATIPVGSIESDEHTYSVRFDGSLDEVDQLENIVVSSTGNTIVYVRDFATVVNGYEPQASIARLVTEEGDLFSAVSLQVFKKGGGNVLDIVREVDEVIDTSIGTMLPSDVVIEVIDDDAEFIREDLNSLSLSGLQTTLIVILLIFILLGPRESLLAGLSIPLTFLITFIFLDRFGYTINFLSLFSLILALGILVDGAIVMTEGMYAGLEKGKTPKQASLDAIKEFRYPLIAGTLTTVFAFLPMITVSGIIGEFIKSIPVTVSIVLFASLFVALGVIPAIGSVVFKQTLPGEVKKETRSDRIRSRIVVGMRNWYRGILQSFLASTKKRFALFTSLIVSFVLIFALPISGLLQIDMFPATDLDRVYIDVELPIGTPLATTAETMQEIESYFYGREYVASYSVSSGSGSSVAGGSGANVGSAVLNLIEDDRPDSRDLQDVYQAELTTLLPDVKVTVQQLSGGPEGGAPVEVKIKGQDLSTLEILAAQYEDLLSSIEGTRTVGSSVLETGGEFVLTADRDILGFYGLTATDIALELRQAVFGTEVMTLQTEGEDLAVIVKYQLGATPEDDAYNRVDIGVLSSFTIQTIRGDVPLSTFLETDLEKGRALVNHIDGDRYVSVTSGVQKGVVPAVIFEEIRTRMDEISVPEDYFVEFGGQDEDIQQSFTDLLIAMAIGMFMIFILLILQFGSYLQPLIVISSVPLALIGVFPGLAIIGVPLSFPGMIGVVALSGIVVNNGIILVDQLNKLRKRGLDMDSAILKACVSRLRPILLTTLTTVAGLLPLVISQPSWAPLGFTIIFGLIFSTVLTLLVVPLLYRKFG